MSDYESNDEYVEDAFERYSKSISLPFLMISSIL